MKWYHWIVLFLAGWLIVSPWFLGFSEINLAAWNNIIIGSLTIVFTLWNLTAFKS